MTDSVEHTDIARQKIQLAKQKDNEEDYTSAFDLYKSGIQHLLDALNEPKNKKHKEMIQTIQSKADQYWIRIKEIQELIHTPSMWTCNALQKWIISLKLDKNTEQKVVNAISEQEITGEDFSSMGAYTDVCESFDIKQAPAKIIYNELVKLTQSTSKPQSQPQKSGIIGLKNLGNTCFMNSVIQALLQTPGLIETLRTTTETTNNAQLSGSMLHAFIYIANQANTTKKSVAPQSIVKCLRNSDVKFRYGEQGDALSAVSKMLELLDKEIIAIVNQECVQHTGSWYHVYDEKEKDMMDEDELIFNEWVKYNPNEASIIREYIHFVERNTFTCMTCGWQEARYDIKEKILLPLEDHSMDIRVNVCIPAIQGARDARWVKDNKYEYILDYCPMQTLRYQIYEKVKAHMQDIDDKCKRGFQLNDINQVCIQYMKPSVNGDIDTWMNTCDEKEECSKYRKYSKSMFAVVSSINDNNNNNEHVIATTYHVFINKDCMVDVMKSYVEFEEMKTGSTKVFANMSNVEYPQKRVYFVQQIFDGAGKQSFSCVITHKNKSIICFWIHKQVQASVIWDMDSIHLENIDTNLIIEMTAQMDGTTPNYEDWIEYIQMKMDELTQSKKQITEDQRDELLSLSNAMVTYKTLLQNQKKAIQFAYDAFVGEEFENKENNLISTSTSKNNAIIGSISAGFQTYCCTKILDRGAVVKCRGECEGKRAVVFKQETKIVRYPHVLIFGIDRYKDSQKFELVIQYGETMYFDENKIKYELYAVCNHVGGLEYGHYWAFVKSIQNGQWYNANDAKITPINVQHTINQASAILLFYKKA